jgi:hypothetical protein
LKLRLPPLLLSRRTGPISMSCDIALHMHRWSARGAGAHSASISTPVL